MRQQHPPQRNSKVERVGKTKRIKIASEIGINQKIEITGTRTQLNPERTIRHARTHQRNQKEVRYCCQLKTNTHGEIQPFARIKLRTYPRHLKTKIVNLYRSMQLVCARLGVRTSNAPAWFEAKLESEGIKRIEMRQFLKENERIHTKIQRNAQ